MLQKLHRVFCKLTYALILCAITTSQSFSQTKKSSSVYASSSKRQKPKITAPPFEQENISISSEEMKILLTKYDEILVYPVQQKTVTEYEKADDIVALEKRDADYEDKKLQREHLNRSQTHRNIRRAPDPIDEYNKRTEYSSKKQEAVRTILSKINSYLSSKEKYRHKQHFLKEAQTLADEYKINIVISEKENVPKGAYANTIRRTLRLYDDNKRIDDKDIEKYKLELSGMEKVEPKKPKEIRVKEKLEEYKNETTERLAYIVDLNTIDPLQIVGEFKVLGDEYWISKSTNYHNVQNELVPDNTNRYNRKSPLLLNIETNQLYYIEAKSFVNALKGVKEFEQLKIAISKYGYKVDENGKIKTKMVTVVLGQWLINSLNDNPNYLKQLDADYAKIVELTKQYPAYSKTLDRYIGLYRIQRNKMSTSDINAWRSSTEKADKLFRQIYELKEKYEFNYWSINPNIDQSKIIDDFMDNLTVSRHILGV